MADEQTERAPIGNKNEKIGEVVSARMQKTIVVEVTRRGPHHRVPPAQQAEALAVGCGDQKSGAGRCRAGSVARRHAAGGRLEITDEEKVIMIGMRTMLDVADNSGARKLQCILPRGGDKGLHAGLGDIVTASVKEAAPDSNVKKGKVVRCVIVRMRKETRRKDGTYIRFDSNAAVLVTELNEPVGTRVFGPVARELRDKKFMKIVSLAPEVI